MIEDFNDIISLAVIIGITLISIIGFVKLNQRKDKEAVSDEYYRDLL